MGVQARGAHFGDRMTEDLVVEEEVARDERVGQRLQRIREEAGYDLTQVAAETRIPQRHLVSIEAGEFDRLPSRTYAIGFSRSYARMLGLDEREIASQVRAELASGDATSGQSTNFEPGDPARIPGRGLAWFGVLAAIIFLAGIYTFYRSYFAPGVGPAPLVEATQAPQPGTRQVARNQSEGAAPSIAASGPVVFTSLMDGTWVKFYDDQGNRLYEAQMAKGDSFTVPSDAQGPQVWTGRPYALAITIGGKPVPKLSEEDTVIRDVPVSAEALLARAEAGDAEEAMPARSEQSRAPAGAVD